MSRGPPPGPGTPTLSTARPLITAPPAQEDDKVRELVTLHGPKKWSLIAAELPGRIGKQCRERWAKPPPFPLRPRERYERGAVSVRKGVLICLGSRLPQVAQPPQPRYQE